MQPDLSAIFGKYAGLEVPMKEEPRQYRIGGEVVTHTEISFADPDHPVLAALCEDAERLGLQLRIWHPGLAGTMEINPARLNVHIGKSADGTWRIEDNMSMDGGLAMPQTYKSIVQRGVDRDIPVSLPLRLKKAGGPA